SVPKPARRLLAAPEAKIDRSRQRRLMFGALVVLLMALGSVLYADRGFWFPDDPIGDDPSTQALPQHVPINSDGTPATATRSRRAQRPHHSQPDEVGETASIASALPPIAISERTVLPPLEVEVVAGDVHKTVRPGSTNSLKVELPTSAVSPSRPADENAAA